jgi:hypothetical protein
VAITRTGSQTIKSALDHSGLGRTPNKNFHYPDVSYRHPQHYSTLDWRVIRGEEDFNSRFKFTFVRNPWSHLVSHYTNHCRVGAAGLRQGDAHRPEVFNKWAKKTLTTRLVEKCGFPPRENQSPCDHYRNIHWNCLDWISDENGNIIVDFIGRYENLEEGWREVRRRIEEHSGVPIPHDPELRNVHVSNVGHDYRYYYNDESIELIRKYYKKDIEEFGYEF